MNTGYTAPKVFISYCQDPPLYAEMTYQFAEKLRSNGIDVIIDIWDLAPGQDIHYFMEKCVNDPEIAKVLIICTEKYSEKSNNKKGGVGKESSIISSELFNQVEQKKFIPIVFQKDDKGHPFVPTFCSSLLRFDLTEINNYEIEFQKIVRDIFNKPNYKKPVLGFAPYYIVEDNNPVKEQYLCSAPLSTIKSIFNSGQNLTDNLIYSFQDLYLLDLEKLKVSSNEYPNINNSNEIASFIISKLDEHIFLRDAIIEYIRCSMRNIAFQNVFLDFLEKILQRVNEISESIKSSYVVHSDLYKIFLYELFLYISAYLFKKSEFDKLAFLLYENYFLKVSYLSEYVSYITFNDSILIFRDKDQNKRITFFKNRSNNPALRYEDIEEIDLLLYYISLFRTSKLGSINNRDWYWWIPFLVSNKTSFSPVFYKKLESRRFFNIVKSLFNVHNQEQLKHMIQDSANDNIDILRKWGWRSFQIEKTFGVDKICSLN